MKKYLKTLLALVMSLTFVFNIKSLNANALFVKQLPNYPTYLQSGANCWAYAILSMVNFTYGGYSISDIYSAYATAIGHPYTLNSGANVNEALKVIKEIYSNYSPKKKGELTSNEIKLEINSNYPVYIRGEDSSGNGHAVALMGYRAPTASGSVDMIYYMNSATGSIMYYGYAEGTGNTFYTNAYQVYDWENSIIING